MFNQHIQLKPFSNNALLLEWPARLDRSISQEVLAVHDFVISQKDWGITDAIPAYHSLLIEFDPAIMNRENLEEKLLTNITDVPAGNRKSKIWEVPVLYEGEDLEMICSRKRITKEQFIQLHTTPEYYVYFIGFLPGFLYLGDLPIALHVPRRSAPRARVPKGSVAIGGQQTGIYPQDSPGGWNIIGHTDFSWFDLTEAIPSKINPGDRLKFIAL